MGLAMTEAAEQTPTLPTVLATAAQVNGRKVDPSAFLQPYGTMQLVLVYFNGIVLLFGAVCNALVLVVLLKNKSLCKVRYFLSANLTLADLGLCLVNFPMFLYNGSQKRYAAGQVGCTLHAFFIVLFCSQSVLTLTATTYERYLMVVKGREFSTGIFKKFLPINWCFSILLAGMPFLWADNPYPLRSSRIYCTGGWYFSGPYEVLFTVLCCCVITTGLCGITIMYRRIFEAIRDNTRRLTSAGGSVLEESPRFPDGPQLGTRAACNSPDPVSSSFPLVDSCVSGNGSGDADVANATTTTFGQAVPVMAAVGMANTSAARRALRSERAIARITFIVTATFFACWGAYNLMFLLEMFTQRESGPLLDGLSATAALFNSTCNPFLFLFDKNIKSAIQDATGCTSKFSRSQVSAVVEEGARSSPVKFRSSATAPGFCRPRIWFWRQKAKPRNQRNWMDIAVNVTVDDVNSAAETGAVRAGPVSDAESVRAAADDRAGRPAPVARTSSVRGANAVNVAGYNRGIQLPPAARTSSVWAAEAADVARYNRGTKLAPTSRTSSVPGVEAVNVSGDNGGAQPVAADSGEDRQS